MGHLTILMMYVFLIFGIKGKKFKIPSGIQTHDLEIRGDRSNPLRYAVRWKKRKYIKLEQSSWQSHE